MRRGIDEMTKRLSNKVDLVIEVRDARIPLSSANPTLERLLVKKRRIVVFNKSDLSAEHANNVIAYWELLML